MSVASARVSWRRFLAVALALALLTSACGGGSEEPSQPSLKAKLNRAASRLASVRSLDLSIGLEAAEAGSNEDLGSGCLDVTAERRGPGEGDDRADLRAYDGACSGGIEGVEAIVIGRDVWLTEDGERWSRARIDRAVLQALTDEETDFAEVVAAAEEIAPASESGTYFGPAGTVESGPKYEFEAPASSLSDAPGADSADVEFEATLDRRGYLRGLVATVSDEGAEAIVTETYEDIEEAGPIEPPPADDVAGPVRRIESKAEFDALLSQGLGSAFG